MSFADNLNAARCCDDVHKTNVVVAFCFQKVDSRHCTAARCEHRVKHDCNSIFRAVWKFAIIFMRFASFFVAVHTDMTDSCCWEECMHAVDHAKTCTKHRDDGDCTVGNHCLFTNFKRRFHHNFLGRDVFKRFINHEGCDFFNEFSEFFHTRVLVTKNCNFVSDERMIKYSNVWIFFHFVPLIYCKSSQRLPLLFCFLSIILQQMLLPVLQPELLRLLLL